MKNHIRFNANTLLIPSLSLFVEIVIITSALSSFVSYLDQKDDRFANAQSQTRNYTININSLGSPLYHSTSGKITALRVIDVGEIPKTEVSFMEKGTMADIGNITNIGTFIETYKTNKIIFGEGKGIIATENGGDIISWVSHDRGKINSDKSESYHGIMFFLGGNNASSNGKLGFLDNTAALYTTSVSVNGSTFRQLWQWK